MKLRQFAAKRCPRCGWPFLLGVRHAVGSRACEDRQKQNAKNAHRSASLIRRYRR